MSIYLFYQHVIQVLCELFIIYFPSIFDDLFWLVNNFSPSSLMRSENLLPKSFKSTAASQSWHETFSCLFLGVSIFTLQKTLASSPWQRMIAPQQPHQYTLWEWNTATHFHTHVLTCGLWGHTKIKAFNNLSSPNFIKCYWWQVSSLRTTTRKKTRVS